MTIIVNDANILIDFIDLELLYNFFCLDFSFYATDLIIEELREDQQKALEPFLSQGTFRVNSMTAIDLMEIQKLVLLYPRLSGQDYSAFLQAKQLDGILLTSDLPLRKFAQKNGLKVHGHLWVFDQMVLDNCISNKVALEKLDELMKVVNPRLGLPKHECEKRRSIWSSRQ